jgi:hypothetical protein
LYAFTLGKGLDQFHLRGVMQAVFGYPMNELGSLSLG